ncbi:uncharacterized protein LOC132931806 [Rhopalosiphum padi]|uniref:uncharacterized protein LOC132931806 n=1 Tax=Rhopalosiphum padi TaxID=40932 RepID=UPI00298E5311|nr:uncharacterized protein LOC132931806 [Rhopalosiphum padi]
MSFRHQIDRILNHLSKSDKNDEGVYYYGHDTKALNQIKNMYKKCRICRSRLRWPFTKTVKCQNCFLTCHETCIKSVICPLGKKSDDQPMGIFESEVYSGQPWKTEDCVWLIQS